MNRTDMMIATEPVNEGTAWTEASFILPEPWVRDALCAQVDPDMFFPNHGDGDSAAPAKSVCRKCDVKAQCLEYALRTRQSVGIWGETSPRDRARMLRDAA
ncbi:WhiB family transcriptional regulator [Microbacterium sp. KNMS]